MISSEFPAVVTYSGGAQMNAPIVCTLSYDSATDPYAVSMKITLGADEVATWLISREFLNDGRVSLKQCGSGDVKMMWSPQRDAVAVCLHNLDGHAHLDLPWQQVGRFMSETFRDTPLGDENVDAQLDEAIEKILA